MEKTALKDCADLLYQSTTAGGAKAYSSTGDRCLDLFYIAGAMRYHNMDRINMKFVEAYRENPELAMKLLFYIRDIRGGIGERDIFRSLMRTVARKWPESAEKNVKWITEYGRWDDLICLMGTKAEKEAVRIIREQLDADLAALEKRKNGDLTAHISLCAKWMPSPNTSSARTRGNARVLMDRLKLTEKQYRAILTPLRAAVSLTEHYVTRREFDQIQYDHVPSQALLRYDSLFTEFDQDRYEAFMRGVRGGYRQMHATTLTPDQIVIRARLLGFEMRNRIRYDKAGGRAPGGYDSYGDISNVIPGRTHLWGRLAPVNIVRRPNSFVEYRFFEGNRTQQSRKWKAYYNRLRRATVSMPMRRFDFVGFYDSQKPLPRNFTFAPGDSRFVKVLLCQYNGKFSDEGLYAIYRIGSRFAGPRHVFREQQDRLPYRMTHVDEFWKSLPGTVGTENAISVIDTSGSMMLYEAHTTADALGLFHAEHAQGVFHKKFITFSDRPKMMKIRGDHLVPRLFSIYRASWGESTDIEAVYRLLLRLAVREKAGRDQMPSAVVVYSDMEFNRSVTNPYGNPYEDFREMFEQAGYEVPALVFHNVNSWQMQAPVLFNTMGTALSSGRTTHHMKHKYTASTTPMRHMLEVLMSERYAPIHA